MSIEMGVMLDLSIASVSVLGVLSMSSLFLSLSSSLSMLSGLFSIGKGKSLNYLVGGVSYENTLKHPPSVLIYRDMRHVKRYQELFEARTELTPEQTEWLDKCTEGKWTLNRQTGLVDVNGSFDCNYQGLTDFKGVRFGVVTGGFNCSVNKLTSLKGAPQEVGGDFECSSNKLTSLKDAPQEVRWDFACYVNELTSLEGAPQVGGSFYPYGNPVSESVLKALYRKMQSGMSWPDAVAEEWDSIESDEDKILLAPHNPNLSPEELKGYQALARLRKRIL